MRTIKILTPICLILALCVCSQAQHVGVHTTSPQAPLHLFSGGQILTPGGLFIMGNPSEAHMVLDFDRLQSKFGIGSNLPMYIQPDGGNLNLSNGGIFIDYNNGEIGLGTASPDAPVHIYGNGELRTPGGRLVIGQTGLAHMELDFDRIQSAHNTNNYLDLDIQPDGGDLNVSNNALFVEGNLNRVGIGTTTTTARLNVRGPGFTSATAGLHITNAFSQSMLYVNDAGNVGVSGVTNPTSALEVGGSIEIASDLKSRNNLNSELTFSANGDDIGLRVDGTEVIFLDGSTSDIHMAVHDNTQVAIGDVPLLDAKLEIFGDLLEDPFAVTGFNAKFIVKSDGDVGVGTLNPEANMHLICDQNTTYGGLEIENVNGMGSEWRLFVNKEDQENNGNLYLYHNDVEKGYFSTGGGGYFSTSDRRRKEDIRQMGTVMDRLKQLEPTSYIFKDDSKHRRSLGFIAQDVQPLFPELVDYSAADDLYTMHYSGLGVIAIKGVQELSEENDALKTKNVELEKRLLRLESLVTDLLER